MLRRFGGEARVLAAGHSLTLLMKLRLALPREPADIHGNVGLPYIPEDGPVLRIGAATCTRDLLDSPLPAKGYPIFADVARELADLLVRNGGTVGGNVCHGEPGAHLPACFVAPGAEVDAVGPYGSRSIPLARFYRNTFVTTLEPDELLVEIRVPRALPAQGSACHKLERRPGDLAAVGVAAGLRRGPIGRMAEAGLALTGVGLRAPLAVEAADALVDQSSDRRVSPAHPG